MNKQDSKIFNLISETQNAIEQIQTHINTLSREVQTLKKDLSDNILRTISVEDNQKLIKDFVNTSSNIQRSWRIIESKQNILVFQIIGLNGKAQYEIIQVEFNRLNSLWFVNMPSENIIEKILDSEKVDQIFKLSNIKEIYKIINE